MEKYKVGIIGCTGMVGQRFITLMEHHPWFRLTALAASARSAGMDAISSCLFYISTGQQARRLSGAVPAVSC